MNKTININLGGLFFHIDEIAFQKLRRYLDTIRHSLSDDPKGRDEIIADIEFRISELLSEKIKDPRQVINEANIDEVINIMGQPEDYVFEEDSDTNYSKSSNTNHNYNSKKLFRDGDDKFLGGVASGLGHYFGVEAIWIRLIWLVLTFGMGIGFLLYIILWILLPEANTTAEKLQMEGEAVNISTIEKKIRDEVKEMSKRAKKGIDDMSGKVKEGVKDATSKVNQKNIKSGFQEVVDVIGKIISTFFVIIGKFIGIILIIVSLSTLIGLIIGLFTAGTLDIFGFDWFIHDDFGFANATGLPIWAVSLMALLLVGIPFLMLFFLGMFIVSSKTKTPGRITWYVLLGLWFMTVIASIVFGIKQTADYAFDGTYVEKQYISSNATDTLRVKMIDSQDLSNYSYLRKRNGYQRITTLDNKIKWYSNNIRLDIRLADEDSSYVKVKKEAEGINRQKAQENAKKITYNYKLNSNTLNFDGYFLTDRGMHFNDQVLDLVLYLPKNKVIYLDNSTQTFLRHIENTKNTYDGDLPKHLYKMTLEGLECLDCNTND